MYNSGIKLTHNFRFSPPWGETRKSFGPDSSPNSVNLQTACGLQLRLNHESAGGYRTRPSSVSAELMSTAISLISSISRTCDRRRASSGLTPRSSPYARSPSMRCSVEGDGKPRKRSTNLRVRQRLACETPTSRSSSNRWRRRHSPEETCTRSSASKHSAQQYSTRQSDQRPEQGRASVG